jgi:hypothetical protein
MITPIAAVIVSFIAPMLALMILFAALARKLRFNPRGSGWCVGLGMIALGVLMIPVAGLPLARVLAAVMDHWSVPLLALLAAGVSKTFFGTELLRREDYRAMWIFGVVTGVVLFPLALGAGSIDPFAYGWHFGPLFVLVGIIALFLQWQKNRFGIVLLLAIFAWLAGVAESGNLWDCITDPIFFFVSVGALVMSFVTKSKQH